MSVIFELDDVFFNLLDISFISYGYINSNNKSRFDILINNTHLFSFHSNDRNMVIQRWSNVLKNVPNSNKILLEMNDNYINLSKVTYVSNLYMFDELSGRYYYKVYFGDKSIEFIEKKFPRETFIKFWMDGVAMSN